MGSVLASEGMLHGWLSKAGLQRMPPRADGQRILTPESTQRQSMTRKSCDAPRIVLADVQCRCDFDFRCIHGTLTRRLWYPGGETWGRQRLTAIEES